MSVDLEIIGLTEEELHTVHSAAGGLIKAAAVARLYKGNEDGSWLYTGSWGVIALVFDKAAVAYHLRLIDLRSKQQIWVQELYYEFQYHTQKPFFHHFEANDSVMGLAFAHELDAKKFAEVVVTYAPSREKLANIANKFRAAGGGATQNLIPITPLETPAATLKKDGKKMSGLLSRFKKKKEPVNKGPSVISGPTNFRHEVHLGWDPRKGFEIRNIPPEWKKLFAAAGVKKSDLKNADTAMFVMETVASAVPGRARNADAASPALPTGMQSQSASPSTPGTPTAPAPPVDPPPMPPPPPPAVPAGPGGLAAAMQARLKVKEGESATGVLKNLNLPDLSKLDEKEGADLAATLAAAMQARRDVLRHDSDEEEEQESDDDEWSDLED